jgi:radical SAM protein with 4Fe4S-binding SPASM domain
MKELGYGDFGLRFHGRVCVGGKRVPVSAAIDLTHRCNNDCVHCYCSLPAGDAGAIRGELTLVEIEKAFDELRDLGCLWLLITGGEPLLRPDFAEVYLAAKRHGFIVSLFTNGTLVTDALVELLRKYPPFAVEITMYGATPESYEKVTRVPGSYRAYWEGVNRLLRGKVKLNLKAMALTVNQHEMRRLNDIARGLGCEFRFDPLLNRRIDGRRHARPEELRVAPEDVLRLDQAFPERMKEHEEFCRKMVGEPVASRKLITCGAGSSTLHLLPDGTVLPCLMLTSLGGSLREKPLREIWERDFQKALDLERDSALDCDRCDLQGLCGQCAGWSLAEYGRMDARVEYLCAIAKKREERFPFLKGA